MNTQPLQNFIRKPLVTGFIVFAILFTLSLLSSYQRYLLFKSASERELSNIANLAKERVQAVLNHSYSATKTLGFIVKEYGIPKDFDNAGRNILESNKFIDAVQLVQGETIVRVYPLKGNENVIGYKVLRDSLRNKEAFKAIQKREIFFAGPFELKQGGVAVVGRIPIFINDKYWGLAAAIVKLQTLINAAEIDTADNPNYLYQLSKINPDTGEEEFFLPNTKSFKQKHSVSIDIPNGSWRLYVIPKGSQLLISPLPFLLLGFLFSLTGGVFAWFFAKQPFELKKLVDEQTLALSKSEENYRNTLERVSDAFISLDNNWNYTYINSKAAELHERSADTLLGKNIWAEYPHVVNESFYDALKKAMTTQQPQLVELYYSKFDRWYEDYIYPSPNGISVYYRDVTEQKKISEAITREKTLSEFILKSLPGVFYLYNKSGNFIRWNKNFETASGYSSDEIKNMNPLDFIDEDEKELLQQKIKSVFENGKDDVEAHIYTKDKRKIPYYFNGFATEYDGKTCLIGMGIDMTEKVKAESAIKVSEENYRYLFDNSPALKFIWDLETLSILEVNKSAVKHYGYTYDELRKMTVLDLRPEEDYEIIKEFADSLNRNNEQVIRRTWRHKKKTGEIMYMDIYSHKIDYHNRKAILSLAKDITEQLYYEDELKKSNDSIRQLNAHLQTIREEERTNIAREIHDELGQQLTCLKMDASWLYKRFDSKEVLTKNRLDAMLAMIDDTIKTVRRIASELRPGILDDLGLIAALEWQSNEFEKHSGIETIFKSEVSDVKINKKTATGIFRIFQETLTNVARHSKATTVHADVAIHDKIFSLSIKDNGIGFDIEDVKNKHTLGLLGMRERVLMFDGNIEIKSLKGNGTNIIVSVPLTEIVDSLTTAS